MSVSFLAHDTRERERERERKGERGQHIVGRWDEWMDGEKDVSRGRRNNAQTHRHWKKQKKSFSSLCMYVQCMYWHTQQNS